MRNRPLPFPTLPDPGKPDTGWTLSETGALRITATVCLAFPVIAIVAYGGILMGIVTLIAIAFGLFVFLLADVVARGGRVR